MGKGSSKVWLLIRGLRLATSSTPLPVPRIDGAQLDIISIIAALKSKQAAMDIRSEEAPGSRGWSAFSELLSSVFPHVATLERPGRRPVGSLRGRDQPWEQLPRQRMTKLG